MHSSYQIKQDNGQRVYFNPLDEKNNLVPPKGCEIFVGKLPRDIHENVLVPIFETAGPIYKLRLMMDFNGRNRGFCFVTYYRREVAQRAMEMFSGYQIRPGCTIGVFKSLDNTRLFVAGIPIDKTRQEVWDEFSTFVDGICDIIMYSSNVDQAINRGYVFIEFESHRFAAIARRRLQPGSLILWESPILVDWAEPLPDPDPAVMAKVTKLYCRNLSVTMTPEHFKLEVNNLIPPEWLVKIHKMGDFAFLHFGTRQHAEIALTKLNGMEFCGRKMEAMWARPEIYSNAHTRDREPAHFCLSTPAKVRRQIRQRQYAKKLQGADLLNMNGYQQFQPQPVSMPPIQPMAYPNYRYPNVIINHLGELEHPYNALGFY